MRHHIPVKEWLAPNAEEAGYGNTDERLVRSMHYLATRGSA
jgi:hypothetical protein